MPQFDQFSFFNQVTYFFIFFFIFYFYVILFFLPLICYILKFRTKKIKKDIKKKFNINFENLNIKFFFNIFFSNLLNNYKKFFNKKKAIYENIENFNTKINPVLNIFYKLQINKKFNQKFFLKKIFY